LPIRTKSTAKIETNLNTLCVVPAPNITSKSWIIYDMQTEAIF